MRAVMIARALGGRVIAVDRHVRALEAARTLGADHVLLSGGEDSVPAAVHEITGRGRHRAPAAGRGADPRPAPPRHTRPTQAASG